MSSCAELGVGDRVEAHAYGVVRFRGEVVDIWEPLALFWAVDAIGERRIIEFAEYAVHLLPRDCR